MSDELPGFFSMIKRGLWHRRAQEDLKKIFQDGGIFPTAGNYPVKYPKYENSYAKRNNCVSIFDFENSKKEKYLITKHEWEKFFFDQYPVTPILSLSREALADKLIPYKVAKEQIGDGHSILIIHHVEAFYPNFVPVSAISGYLINCSVDCSGNTYEYFAHKGAMPGIFKKIDEFVEKHQKFYEKHEKWRQVEEKLNSTFEK